MTKADLNALLDNYPDDARIEIHLSDLDLATCISRGGASGEAPHLYAFDLAADRSFDEDENVLGFQVWKAKLSAKK